MPNPTTHEALIYLMVVASASDRDMSDPELGRIGEVVRSWPVFEDFDTDRLIEVAQECQLIVQGENGLDEVLALARHVIPKRLHDTAYAAAFEVAAADLEMRMEEARILQRLGEALGIDENTMNALEIAGKARCRTLT
jgi:tellurite resistance protein